MVSTAYSEGSEKSTGKRILEKSREQESAIVSKILVKLLLPKKMSDDWGQVFHAELIYPLYIDNSNSFKGAVGNGTGRRQSGDHHRIDLWNR